MTTFIIRREAVWLHSLAMSEPSGTIILLCEDGSHVVVPAVLLLAASPLLRVLMTDQLPPLYSPIVLSIPGVTEDILQAVSDILATGRATGDMAAKINEVKEVFKMLGVSESFVCFSLEKINVINVFDKNQGATLEKSEINSNDLDIKLEISIEEEMDTIEDNVTEAGRSKYEASDVVEGKTDRLGKSLKVVKKVTEDIFKIQRAAFKAKRKATQLNTGTKLVPQTNPLKEGNTFGSKIDGGGHPVQLAGVASTSQVVGGVLSSQIVDEVPSSQIVGGAPSNQKPDGSHSIQIVSGDPPCQKIGGVHTTQLLVGAPYSMTDPAPSLGPAVGLQQKVTIVKSTDGKIKVLGLLPGQQLVKLPNGKLQIFSTKTGSRQGKS